MSEWKAKRFWTEVCVVAVEGGFRVMLDGRGVATPGKLPLILPTRAMADAVAAEWAAQEGEVKPLTMPNTRSANSAVERVAPQHRQVAEMLASYGETDLLCYRAERPADLTLRQAEGWDPLLAWAAERYDATLRVTAGVLPVDQPQDSVNRLAQAVAGVPPFPMTALHDLVTLTGSLVLGLAVAEKRLTANHAWDLSRIDEAWQMAQWGEDAEAAEAAAARAEQLQHAERFWRLCFAD